MNVKFMVCVYKYVVKEGERMKGIWDLFVFFLNFLWCYNYFKMYKKYIVFGIFSGPQENWEKLVLYGKFNYTKVMDTAFLQKILLSKKIDHYKKVIFINKSKHSYKCWIKYYIIHSFNTILSQCVYSLDSEEKHWVHS